MRNTPLFILLTAALPALLITQSPAVLLVGFYDFQNGPGPEEQPLQPAITGSVMNNPQGTSGATSYTGFYGTSSFAVPYDTNRSLSLVPKVDYGVNYQSNDKSLTIRISNSSNSPYALESLFFNIGEGFGDSSFGYTVTGGPANIELSPPQAIGNSDIYNGGARGIDISRFELAPQGFLDLTWTATGTRATDPNNKGALREDGGIFLDNIAITGNLAPANVPESGSLAVPVVLLMSGLLSLRRRLN